QGSGEAIELCGNCSRLHRSGKGSGSDRFQRAFDRGHSLTIAGAPKLSPAIGGRPYVPNDNQLPHLLIQGRFTTEKYISPPGGGGGEYNLPVRDRARHGVTLLQQLGEARQENERRR